MTVDIDKIQLESHKEYMQRLNNIQHRVLCELLSGRRGVPDTEFEFEFQFVAYIDHEKYRGVSLSDLRAHLAKIGVNVQTMGVLFDGLRMDFSLDFIRNYEPVMKTVTESHRFRKDSLVEVPANEIDRVKLALVRLYPSFTDEQLMKYVLRDSHVSHLHKRRLCMELNDIRYFAMRDFTRRQGASRSEGTVFEGDIFTFDF